MINTNELMLGNLVEYKNKYYKVGSIFTREVLLEGMFGRIFAIDINPIELTDEVLKKLGSIFSSIKTVHLYQNWNKANGVDIDITPLLKPKPILTTHDGVEVFDKNALVWVCSVDGMYSDTKNKNVPARFKAKMALSIMNDYMCVFSTESACSEYINQKWAELHPEPIFVTEDGVEVFDKDAIVFSVYKTGVCPFDETKDNPTSEVVSKLLLEQCDQLMLFSTRELAQSYINQKWAELHPEPIFVTEDGVKMFEGMDFYFVEASGYYSGSKKSTIKHSKCYKDTKKNKEYKDFSTEQLAQAYLNKVWVDAEYNKLLKSTQCQNK
jgi:uncharacterized protein YbdZ (MbtH family)